MKSAKQFFSKQVESGAEIEKSAKKFVRAEFPDWKLYHHVPLPYDSEGFVKTFNIENYDPQQMKEFYDNYGLVVFENILTEEQTENTIDDLWKQVLEIYSHGPQKVDRNNPDSWKFFGMHKSFGFVGDDPINQPQIWRNRINPKVYKCFKQLYEISSGLQMKEPLITNFDRGSMMRPTDKYPEYKTRSVYHFDIDPWHWTGEQSDTSYEQYNEGYRQFLSYRMMMGEGNYLPFMGYTKLAGVITLSETNEKSGGFEAACGFQNYIQKWCKAIPSIEYQGIQADKQLMKTFQKVTMRKGSLMLFSRQLPHNIYPNKSGNFRYAQYIRMTPLSTLMLTPEMVKKRKKLVSLVIPKDLERTEICKETMMLD